MLLNDILKFDCDSDLLIQSQSEEYQTFTDVISYFMGDQISEGKID